MVGVDRSTIVRRFDFLNIEKHYDGKYIFFTKEQVDFALNYFNTHDISNEMWEETLKRTKYEGYTLLSELSKELNLANIPYNYCDYLNIKIYKFYNKLSGRESCYIKDEDCNKLINYINSTSLEERRLFFTKNTNNEKFGCDFPSQNEEIKGKVKNIFISKYGVDNPNKCEDIHNKSKLTNLKKYGVENPFQSKECKEKSKNTIISKYGSLNNFKKIVNDRKHHKWRVENLEFDSKWEIYVYFYFLRNDIPFEIQVPIKYEWNGERTYFCDFHRLDTDEYIEIKGNHLIKDGKLNSIFKSEDSQSKLDAKTKCMYDNNVQIYLRDDIVFYMKWFKENCKDVEIINNKTGEKLKYIRI